MKKENTFGYQICFGALCFGTKFRFNGGKTIYKYVGKTEDWREEEVTFLDGSKTVTGIASSVYVLQNEKGEYKAFHNDEIKSKQISILN